MVIWKNSFLKINRHQFKLSKYSYLSTAPITHTSRFGIRGDDKTMVKSNGFTPPPSRTADEIIKENDTNSIAKKDIIVDNESTKLPHNPDESIEHTTVLNIVDPLSQKKWPLFSLLDIHGKLLPNAKLPVIEKDHMLQMYRMMTRIKILDDVFFNAQRQGRISFYMQNTGEEAVHIGICVHIDEYTYFIYVQIDTHFLFM
jgi:hypothetical protein